jgi:hypothetical protein
MALKKRTISRVAEKLAVEAEPGLTTAQLMVRPPCRVPVSESAVLLTAMTSHS